MKKNVVVLTDNDGNPERIKDRYKDYINNQYVHFHYEKNPKLHTLEPAIIAVNSKKGNDGEWIPDIYFQYIVNHQTKDQMTFGELDKFMQDNKVEWALRVFESSDTISFPQYIIDGIKDVKKCC